MSKNQHRDEKSQRSANQNNQMSDDDPADGNRTSFTTGKDGTTPVEKAPPGDRQDKAAIEVFGDEGAGVAAKE
ncbi:MAG: hypothetical protein H0U83_07900 [Sphingomonas sp.]|jgi:hypothetical protein|nr:hypothetical protein [Sphingomonas sp.]